MIHLLIDNLKIQVIFLYFYVIIYDYFVSYNAESHKKNYHPSTMFNQKVPNHLSYFVRGAVKVIISQWLKVLNLFLVVILNVCCSFLFFHWFIVRTK